MFVIIICLSLICLHSVESVCPYLFAGTPRNGSAIVPDLEEYNEALDDLDIVNVFKDIRQLLTDSQDCWPADIFNGESNYGGLFVRLAWHCSGTFRATDGVGGCAGGRQRFWPEASWDDNTNLDKARALLGPIKEKYGDSLSWGDLMVFSGTASIYYMDGPVTQICAGRIDSPDGEESEPLGPGPDAPECEEQGNCQPPLGADTIGLIYVNPEGVMGVPNITLSAPRIREVFSRMDMNDTETVALIGGGHAFGKSHGACPDGAGSPPSEQPDNPWPGNCGNGVGLNTTTSGIEGQWTEFPFKWDNEYFTQLIEDEYTLITGSGGKYQWRNNRTGYLMLTTDLALISDDTYYDIVYSYAEDIEILNNAFGAAWEKLVTQGGVWANNSFCIDSSELREKEDEESWWDENQLYVIIPIVVLGSLILLYVLYQCFVKAKAHDIDQDATLPLVKHKK